MVAAAHGNTNLVKMLVAKGCDVTKRATGGGTALHVAAYQGTLPVVHMLLDAGANPLAYGARFQTEIYTRGCHWIPRMFA
jgi:ankyrin repeat protein